MNYSTAVFLINRDIRAVLAVYEKDDYAEPSKSNGSKRTMFKTLDPTIKKDDYVVVPTSTRHGMTVVKVTDVDVSVDFDDSTKVDWVVARVDRTRHEETLRMEAEAVEALRRAEFRKRRATLFSDLVADKDDEIKSLPIYKNGDVDSAGSAKVDRVGGTWRHKKRGTTYDHVERATLQYSSRDEFIDGEEMRVYRGHDGRLWVRSAAEFHDGRFEEVG